MFFLLFAMFLTSSAWGEVTLEENIQQIKKQFEEDNNMGLREEMEEEAEEEEDKEKEDEENDDEEEELAPAPFKLVGEKLHIDVGELTELKSHEFLFEVENKTKDKVFYKRVMSGCSCLTILEAPEPGEIGPGGKIAVKARIDGQELKPVNGKFERAIYIEARGCYPSGVAIRGDFYSLIKVEPSSLLDLGRFEGVNVPWTRKFTITLTKPDESPDFDLNLPAESKNFNFKLTKIKEKNTFILEFSPKLPMTPGRLTEFIYLPANNMDKGVRLRVIGMVTGIRIGWGPNHFTVFENDFENGNCPELIVKLGRREDKPRQRNLGFMTLDSRERFMTERRRKKEAKRRAEDAAVYVDEESVRDKEGMQTWGQYAKDITINVPDFITVVKEPHDNALWLKLKVSDGLLKAPSQRAVVELVYGGRVHGKIDIRLRKEPVEGRAK